MRFKQDAIPGRLIRGWFKPTKTGEYDIQCAEMCGIGHGPMGARLYIHTADEYENRQKNANARLAAH
jgi:cytochrome c oxidase subunit 2